MVCGEVDFGAMVIAEHLGLPHAAVIAFATGQRLRPDDVAEPLNELRAEYGLPADPDMRMLNRYLRMSPFPPSFRHPEAPLSDGGHSFRYDPRPNEGTPPWAAQRPGAPTVYFTLGTVFNTESGDLFSRVLSGLGELPVNVLVTVGNNIDPAEFGPQPDNIHVARYVPQGQVLPYCDLVVSHAGSGSVLGAIAHGLPSVYIPIGADQPQNAARCVQLGLGRILDAVTVTPPEIRDAVAAELADPAHRNATRRLRAEFAAQPSPEEMVPLLEKLVAETPAAPRLALPLG
jgi:UDP:flavonoid glycosyltransferase YjiC (YdhE family)